MMLDMLKIVLVFALILVLLRIKWKIGYVLMTASGLLALLYMMPPAAIADTVRATVTDIVTIKLFLALTLIRVLEMVLRERQVLARMMETSRELLRRKKAVLISMPLLIGLLPSLGGAYFSAPMVEESSKGLKLTQEEKAFINYWYRHPWEFMLPLYPGILLAAAVTGIELRSLVLTNGVFAALLFATGFFFSMQNVTGKFPATAAHHGTARRDGLLSFLPVAAILVMVIAFNIELHYAMLATIGFLIIYYRFGLKDIGRLLKYGFTAEVVTLVFGVMLLKLTMENSGAVVQVSGYLAEKGIPLLPILFLLPFVSGMLTGISVGFVGGTFPLLISLSGGVHLGEITFAFCAGFIGVLLSPVHLCLVLTREYFKADLWGVYKKIIPACCIILAAAFGMYAVL